MAGYKSLFAFWAGGAGSVTPTVSGGRRSMLAPWIGGASATTTSTSGGYRSLLAFWSGGAFGYESIETQIQPSGGFESANLWNRRRTKKDIEKARKEYGIAFEVIESVAKRQSEDLHLDEQQRFDELQGELKLRNIEFESKYYEYLNVLREQYIHNEIARLIKENAIKEDEIVFMMLATMVSSKII